MAPPEGAAGVREDEFVFVLVAPVLLTFTFTLLEIDPPWPTQTKEYLFEEVRLPVENVPDDPLESPQSPEAVQEVAFVVDQRSSTEVPPLVEVSLAEKVKVGADTVLTASETAVVFVQLEFGGAIALQDPLH